MSPNARTPNAPFGALRASTTCAAGRLKRGPLRVGLKLLQVVLLLALAAASYWVISRFFLASVQVVGESMLPALHDSEHLLLNRWIYRLRTPRAGEIVVFRDPVDHSLAVKRVIGIPGDVVDIAEGSVFRNGAKLSEPYLARGMPTFPYLTRRVQSFLCGQSQYLVLGDNRKNSADSRTYGLIPRQEILGRVVR